ncbi:hypothetical protein SMKI_02G0220 [Saccharomyces mikatae IFO 1815]|uniref:MSP domain-containing protein n=1 Tax=Saccharomyces mikatae IFO 1815 TaxID=226126 RepID=A0AA35NEZ4_SACMI|nr:uncharacterized protein SMKI_02G0220 [Saccharomyces mikatae IFO 1815]CAI4037159.1 hypothetical protein SMKI_02G0220 [Saccharomyces mikatae IFO 1815]
MRVVPEQLVFKAPLNEQSTAYIKLENDDDKRVIFKVRTSAPTKYCVRPNVAIIGAHESVKVQIVFLGLPKSVSEQEIKQKQDKFLIVTLPIPKSYADMEDEKLLSNWPNLEEQYKDDIIFKKIKVFHSASPRRNPSSNHGSKISRMSPSPDDRQGLSTSTLVIMALIALLVSWIYY